MTDTTEAAAIPLHLIGASVHRLRQPNEETVAKLAESIKEVGLLHSVVVRTASVADRGITVAGYHVVAGGNRVEACRRLGWLEIPATVVTLDELHCQLAEVDENLCGPTLSPAEEKLFMRRRKEIYEQINPETRNGANGGRGGKTIENDKMSFSNDTAAKTGRSKRTVERIIAVANELGEAVLTGIAGTSLDSNAGIKLLMEADPEERWPMVERAVSGEDLMPKSPKSPATKSARHAVSITDEAKQSVTEFWEWIDEIGQGEAAAHMSDTGTPLEAAGVPAGAVDAAGAAAGADDSTDAPGAAGSTRQRLGGEAKAERAADIRRRLAAGESKPEIMSVLGISLATLNRDIA